MLRIARERKACVKEGNPVAEPRLLTLAEVAGLLRVSVRTVQRLAESGRLPVIRISRKMTRFEASDVEALLSVSRQGDVPARSEPLAHSASKVPTLVSRDLDTGVIRKE